MAKLKHTWPEKIFYHLQLHEKRYFRRILFIIALILSIQWALTVPAIRRYLVLVERFEGEPLRVFRKF
ncbi:MAG TPA: hypothetical protein PLC07_08320 [Bacillota bacterium]|nr:hypothetical protein [Bacillota bacterium]HPT88240.1 hypothetical protein [Bacillota bacterium]